MSATRVVDRQAARETALTIATRVIDAHRQRRGVAGAKVWEITETVPGTFRVVTNGGDYAVWYFPRIDKWACSCPDFQNRRRVCKHIVGVRSREDLVDPDTQIPLSLQGQAEGEGHTLPLGQISPVEDTRMERQNRFTKQVASALATPFDLLAHSFKPGATNRDKTRALALTYVDPRLYQTRLDAVDPAWASQYQVIALDDRLLVNCTLTVLGVTREDVGEALLMAEQRGKTVPDENAYTSAVAQAFKRACAQFGLGRYLYDAPKTWAEYDGDRRQFTMNGLARLRKALARATGASGSKARTQRTGQPTRQTRSGNGASSQPETLDAVQSAYVKGLLADLGYQTDEAQAQALAKAGFPPCEHMTDEQAGQLIARLESKLKGVPVGTNGQSTHA
jgi:hypothetical protein